MKPSSFNPGNTLRGAAETAGASSRVRPILAIRVAVMAVNSRTAASERRGMVNLGGGQKALSWGGHR
jgi:hypothetical protein